MKQRLQQLEEQQRLLLQRSERQRRGIAAHARDIGATFASVERGVAVARQLTTTPALVAGASVLMFAAGPSRLLRWASRILLAVTLARRAAAMWSRVSRGAG